MGLLSLWDLEEPANVKPSRGLTIGREIPEKFLNDPSASDFDFFSALALFSINSRSAALPILNMDDAAIVLSFSMCPSVRFSVLAANATLSSL